MLGESGSGKSVTAQAIMGILDMPPGRITGGEILFQGQDLLKLKEEERRKVRGAEMAMIFQDALSSLNPVLSVGDQLGEMFVVHRGMSRKDARAKAVELMDRVRIPAAEERVRDYPHQFSGGMRQRIMIAMALALEPALIIADEPTTALDVTVQAQVMDLLAELQRELRHGPHPHHPRPRRGRGRRRPHRRDVRGPDRRVGPGPRHLQGPGPPVHPGPARLDPAPGPEGPGAVRHQGPAAQPHEHPARLRLQPPLPDGPDVCRTDVPPLYDVERRTGPDERLPLLEGVPR